MFKLFCFRAPIHLTYSWKPQHKLHKERLKKTLEGHRTEVRWHRGLKDKTPAAFYVLVPQLIDNILHSAFTGCLHIHTQRWPITHPTNNSQFPLPLVVYHSLFSLSLSPSLCLCFFPTVCVWSKKKTDGSGTVQQRDRECNRLRRRHRQTKERPRAEWMRDRKQHQWSISVSQ